MSLSKSGDSRPSGPDLLGQPSAAAGNHRILSQLEHGVAPPLIAAPPGPHAAWWRPAGAALGVVLATVTLLAMLSTHTEQDAAQDSGPASPAPAHTTTQATVQVAASVPSLPPPGPATATIINLASPATPASIAVPAVKVAERKTVITERKAATARPTPAGNSDNDVALLTAMVAHAHRQDGAQDRGRAEPARDVVVRKEEEETISLLQRCKQLGLIEGMLCRSRICSGRWDSDPACH